MTAKKKPPPPFRITTPVDHVLVATLRRGDGTVVYSTEGTDQLAYVCIEADGEEFHIPLRRANHAIGHGIEIRLRAQSLDIEPIVSNVIRVKTRAR